MNQRRHGHPSEVPMDVRNEPYRIQHRTVIALFRWLANEFRVAQPLRCGGRGQRKHPKKRSNPGTTEISRDESSRSE
jgi:hypothetical protein